MVSKPKIVQYLKNKGIYEKTDIALIDELLFCQKHLSAIKKEMNRPDFKYLLSVGTKGYLVKNQLISEYHSFLNNLLKLSAKLGLSNQDRIKLKIGEKGEPSDGF